MTTYVQTEYKQAYLSGDFGRDYACKVFGLTVEQLEAKVGRYVRGKRVGLLRGMISWKKVTRGGWVKTGRYDFNAGQASGFVCRDVGLTFGHCLFDGKGIQIEGPGERVSDAALISEALDRKYSRKAAPVAEAVIPGPSNHAEILYQLAAFRAEQPEKWMQPHEELIRKVAADLIAGTYPKIG